MSDEITQVAIRWNKMRREALDLKRARNTEDCERTFSLNDSSTEPEDAGQRLYERWHPCWREETDDWCESCLRRQRFHDSYLAAAKSRGALLRRLERLVEAVSP